MRLPRKQSLVAAFRAVNTDRKNDNISVRFDDDFTNMLGIIIENDDDDGSYLAVKFHPKIMEEDVAVKAVFDGIKFREVMQNLKAKTSDRIELKFDHARSAVNILVNGKSQGYVDFQAIGDVKVEYTMKEIHHYSSDHFKDLLNYLASLASRDKNRPVLNYINISEDGSRLLSTDCRAVGRINDLNPGHDNTFNEINIYRTIAKEAKIILGDDRLAVMSFNPKNNVYIDGYYGLTDGSTCMINKLPCKYPEVTKAYIGKDDPKYKIAVSRKQLADAAEALNKINEHNNKNIQLSISEDLETLTLHQKGRILNNISADIDIKFADAIDVADVENVVFDRMSLCVEHLHKVLGRLNDDTVILRFVLSNGRDEDTRDSLMFPTRRNPIFIEAPSINGDMLIMPLRSWDKRR